MRTRSWRRLCLVSVKAADGQSAVPNTPSLAFTMGILQSLAAVFKRHPKPPPSLGFDPEDFIYVKIPGNIQPMERGELFEDRIDPVLAAGGLGSVSGGGSSLGDARSDGSRLVEFCGIDIDTTQRDGALAALRDVLPKLDAPMGTQLHYTRAGVRLQDELTAHGWSMGQPRGYLHPGFGN